MLQSASIDNSGQLRQKIIQKKTLWKEKKINHQEWFDEFLPDCLYLFEGDMKDSFWPHTSHLMSASAVLATSLPPHPLPPIQNAVNQDWLPGRGTWEVGRWARKLERPLAQSWPCCLSKSGIFSLPLSTQRQRNLRGACLTLIGLEQSLINHSYPCWLGWGGGGRWGGELSLPICLECFRSRGAETDMLQTNGIDWFPH